MAQGLVMVCDVDLSTPDATRTHTVEVAGGFAREGFDVDLVTRGPDPGIVRVLHTPSRGADRPRGKRVASLNLEAVRLLWRRRQTARRLYVRNRWSVPLVLIAGRLLGYRVVTQVDDVPFGRGHQRKIGIVDDYAKRLLTILMGRLAHGVVAVTPEIKALLVDQFGVPQENIAVLPNGVDIDFIRPLPRNAAIARSRLDPDLRYIVFCGNFAPWVDFDTLLAALAIVARSRPDARLLLVGDGPMRTRVEDTARALRIDDIVIITGFVSDRPRVRDYLAAATIAVASHANDYIDRIGVSPTKLAEYMAAGRAVVVKEVPGMRDVVERTGSGIVVPGNPQAMAEAILTLLDPGRADKLGANGRRVAEERFAWPSIVKRTLPLFGI